MYVGDFTPPPASELPEQMDALIEWLNSPSSLALHPVEFAALAHYRLVTIHPFYDGNGRTSRLLMNLILMQAGFPPVSIEVSDRLAYYETLQQGNDGDIRPFIRFIARCAERTLDEYLSVTVEDYGNVIHTAMLQKSRFQPQERVIVVGEDREDDDDSVLPSHTESHDGIQSKDRSSSFKDKRHDELLFGHEAFSSVSDKNYGSNHGDSEPTFSNNGENYEGPVHTEEHIYVKRHSKPRNSGDAPCTEDESDYFFKERRKAAENDEMENLNSGSKSNMDL